ncbi:MAG: hypothetical protein J2P47_03795 [Acetobacteraceae bacterium]|nr:hypothetical protein [Acetobacteraceae bacterium]
MAYDDVLDACPWGGRWQDRCEWCLAREDNIDTRSLDFLNSLRTRSWHRIALSEKQEQWLNDICVRLENE